MNLPSISVSISCGACGSELEHDGDQYVCFDCGLCWPDGDPFDDSPAEFLDDGADPCNHPSGDKNRVDVQPFRRVNGVVEEWREWTHVYAACNLPAEHKSDHDYPLTTIFKDLKEKP